MIETVVLWGGIATAVTAILTLVVKMYSLLRKIFKEFAELKEHNTENYLNNLRLVIMSEEMPMSERLTAGKKYIDAHGNGAVKAYYLKLQKQYIESEEKI